MSVSFTVYGKAEPAGSKRAFVNPKTGRAIVTDANAKSRPWKSQVSDAAIEAMTTGGVDGSRVLELRPLLEGPLLLYITFYLPRPKGHYGKNGVRPSAPPYPAVRPDTTKLLRAIEDALTGIVWRDDAQVVTQHAAKVYGEPARVEIHVKPVVFVGVA